LNALVIVKNLKKYFPVKGGVFRTTIGYVKAVDGISLYIRRGECLGLVGESGCGKTTFGKTVIRLLKPTEGSIYFDVPPDVIERIEELEKRNPKDPELERLRKEYDLATYKGSRLKRLRRRMQIVYQDPSTSLNPRMLVKDIVGEPLKVFKLVDGNEVTERVLATLERVGLSEQHLYRYPHEFSGGQRQRIAIARAIILQPEFIVLDEPTSAVDVSVKAQLLKLFKSLQEDMKLTYLFISHELNIVESISDRVGVMYLGRLVELAPTRTLFKKQLHPYTEALFSAIPIPDPDAKKKRILLRGNVPSPVNPPSGCRFHPRCPYAMDICREKEPPLEEVESGHTVACWLYAKR